MLPLDRMSADHEQGHEWDDAAFRARVALLAEKQHRSVRDVCVKAGLAADYLSKVNYSGRNIRAILALAHALNVPVAMLIGEADHDAAPTVDSRLLRRLALLAHVASHLYTSLDTEQRATSPDIERIARMVMKLVELDPTPPESR